MKRRSFLATTALGVAASLSFATMAMAENPVLKIGFVGVTSGPAAAWGTSNQRSMETRAAWLNELGGVKIGDTTYDIEMARAAGVTPIGVSWGYHPVSALEAAGAARIVNSFTELEAAVLEILEEVA